MSTCKHLEKAPIAEAVIEFGVVPPEGISVENLNPLKKKWGKTYEFEDFQLAEGKINFEFKTGKMTKELTKKQHIGFRGPHKTKQNEALTVTTSSLACHMLPQYTDWEDLFGTAWELWETYRETVKPAKIRRLAGRYISKLELSMADNWDVYIEHPPSIPSGFGMAGCEMRSSIFHIDSLLWAESVLSLKSANENEVIIALDNDVHRKNLDIDPKDSHQIKEIFSQIRSVKNDLFFETLTEKALEKYE
jgi:uncharacterized protein (TIGR04255 family)